MKTMTGTQKQIERPQGILRRLAKDESGNAMLIITAGLFPLLAAVGGGVDMTRGYMAEARLAQTCDAAALAGRKVLPEDTSPSMGGTDAGSVEIDQFVDYNFKDGTFGSTPIEWEADVNSTNGEMTLTLSTAVPTSLMRVVGVETLPISVSCSSQRSGNNVDVVLVLDVTGSMGETLGSKTRIEALQDATKSLLAVMGNLRTQLGPAGLRVRVGVVPYSQSVNIGHLLYEEDSSYIETTGKYYAREYERIQCRWFNNYCYTNNDYYNNRWYDKAQDYFGYPREEEMQLNLSGFVSRGVGGGTSPYDWKGCVEARPTRQDINASTPLSSIPEDAWDIIDRAPDGTAPAWQPYIYLPDRGLALSGTSGADQFPGRYGPPSSGAAASDNTFKLPEDNGDTTTRLPYRIRNGFRPNAIAEYGSVSDNRSSAPGPNWGCPDEALLLTEDSISDLEDYIDDLNVGGNTYHDVGMYWGLAMISPRAPFENDNVHGGRPVARYLVFMSDGLMNTNGSLYSSYGYGRYKTSYGNNVTTGADADPVEQHRRRFRLLCESAKRQGIEVSTIAFSSDVGGADEDAIRSCATTVDHFYEADSAEALGDAFERIGQNIGYLRVSK